MQRNFIRKLRFDVTWISKNKWKLTIFLILLQRPDSISDIFQREKEYETLLLAKFYNTKKFLTCKYNKDDTLWISLFLIQM